MPILVKDFNWDQSNDYISVLVPLKAVNPKNVSLFTTDFYLKVSFPPFFYECFLYASTINEESSVKIGNGQVVFRLKKSEPGFWERLENEASASEEGRKKLRERAIEDHRQAEETKAKKLDELRYELKSFGVKEQIKLEQDHRQWIEGEKSKEREKAEKELEAWKEQQRQEKENVNINDDMVFEEISSKPKDEPLKTPKVNRNHIKTQAKARPTKKTIENIFDESAPIRSQGRLSISFTPRVFPTPTRESMTDEENEWLRKQAEARKVIELEDANLSEEEKNPIWLRDKGNRFFEEGNYESAINAYTHAIRLSGNMASLYSNRAACHLKLGNCFRCLEDCSKALELLTPPVEQNRLSRIKVHLRRGTAFVTLKMFTEGLMDYEAALKLEPDNHVIGRDAEKIRAIVQGSPTEV